MSPEEIIYGIRGAEKERAAVVKYLCRDGQLWSSIRQYVKGHAGSEEDARMVFDDTIVQFIKSVFSNPAFQLQGPLNAYLMGIAKHLWYAESRRNMQRMDTFPLEDADVANDDVARGAKGDASADPGANWQELPRSVDVLGQWV